MNLPSRDEVPVFGWGKSRAIRVLWVEGCSVAEICAALQVSRNLIATALHWKGHVRIA